MKNYEIMLKDKNTICVLAEKYSKNDYVGAYEFTLFGFTSALVPIAIVENIKEF